MRRLATAETILKENQVALSLDKYGEVAVTSHIKRAFANSGKVIVTDEVGNDKGRPVFNGVSIEVYGGGKGYVYTSKFNRENDIRYITLDGSYAVDESVTVDQSVFPKAKHKAYQIANEFYLMLK